MMIMHNGAALISILNKHANTAEHTARSAQVDPPRTWAPSLGSRVRGCVILEYLKGEQHGSAAVCGLLQREQGDL